MPLRRPTVQTWLGRIADARAETFPSNDRRTHLRRLPSGRNGRSSCSVGRGVGNHRPSPTVCVPRTDSATQDAGRQPWGFSNSPE